MGRSRPSLKRSLLLSVFATVSLLAATGSAQGGSATSMGTVTISDTNPANQATNSLSSLPKLGGTTSTTATSSGASSESINTGMPTLPKTDTIPTYPPPTVPPTQDAPFMNHSTLPDGTVFIAVGAILGAFGAAILAWRTIVACLLHRSVERAALAQLQANDKAAASFPAPPAPFYKFNERDSTPSIASPAANSGRGVRRTQRGPTPSATPSQTNLFFSPTAPGGGGGGGGGSPSPAHRESRYLPSGFYAASSSSPLGPNGGHGASISLSNLRPSSRGAPHLGPSPPDSPSLMGSRNTPLPHNFSSSSINLNHPPSRRAPSAYLDDLLDENPGMFPPQQPMPQGTPHLGPYHSPQGSQGSHNRF